MDEVPVTTNVHYRAYTTFTGKDMSAIVTSFTSLLLNINTNIPRLTTSTAEQKPPQWYPIKGRPGSSRPKIRKKKNRFFGIFFLEIYRFWRTCFWNMVLWRVFITLLDCQVSNTTIFAHKKTSKLVEFKLVPVATAQRRAAILVSFESCSLLLSNFGRKRFSLWQQWS